MVCFEQVIPAGGDGAADGQVFWEHYWDCDVCCYPDRSGDVRSVTKVSDFYSARQWHGTGMYSDVFRPQGLDRELILCLPEAGRAAPASDLTDTGSGPIAFQPETTDASSAGPVAAIAFAVPANTETASTTATPERQAAAARSRARRSAAQ